MEERKRNKQEKDGRKNEQKIGEGWGKDDQRREEGKEKVRSMKRRRLGGRIINEKEKVVRKDDLLKEEGWEKA